ncbi:MAG: hypothetical protein F4X54_10695 [Chloroflexi bacterium]|nr:hypothetical protein [Chloroflexota bacterium]MYB85182.1 hypothetical protein [Chloroflexota bacterium]
MRRFNFPLIVFWFGLLVVAAVAYPVGVPELLFLVAGAGLSQAFTWLRDSQLRDRRLRSWIPVIQGAMAEQENWNTLYDKANKLSEAGADTEALMIEAKIALAGISTRVVVAAGMLDGAAHIEFTDGSLLVTLDEKYLKD